MGYLIIGHSRVLRLIKSWSITGQSNESIKKTKTISGCSGPQKSPESAFANLEWASIIIRLTKKGRQGIINSIKIRGRILNMNGNVYQDLVKQL